ncbi:hypothetical protein D9M72_542040 [compost metagenome]
MAVEIFDDDGGFGHHDITGAVGQNRHLADRPECCKAGRFLRIEQIDKAALEGGIVLVKRDQHLMAEGRKRMLVKREGHADGLRLGRFQ